jgi:hypothetical protein
MKTYTINLLFYEKLKNAPFIMIKGWGELYKRDSHGYDYPQIYTLDDNSITIKIKQVN